MHKTGLSRFKPMYRDNKFYGMRIDNQIVPLSEIQVRKIKMTHDDMDADIETNYIVVAENEMYADAFVETKPDSMSLANCRIQIPNGDFKKYFVGTDENGYDVLNITNKKNPKPLN